MINFIFIIFFTVTEISIIGLFIKTYNTLKEANPVEQMINQAVFERRSLYESWDKLLKLIGETQSDIPVTINRIAELTEIPKENAENLLILLLEEYQDIGVYHKLEQVYLKGSDIDSHIDDLIRAFEKQETNKIGKID